MKLFSTGRKGISLARITALVLLIALGALIMGCYGKFPLTHSIYNINGDVSGNKLIRTVIFWAFVIIPVYKVAMIVDALVFNLIQYWTGKKTSIGTVIEKDGVEYALTPSEDGNVLFLTVSRDGVALDEMRFVRISDATCEIQDRDGSTTGYIISDAGGNLSFTDCEGNDLGSINSVEIDKILSMTE